MLGFSLAVSGEGCQGGLGGSEKERSEERPPDLMMGAVLERRVRVRADSSENLS